MNKIFTLLASLALVPAIFSSESSLEILTVEMQTSYQATLRFPGKILPRNYSKLAFEVSGKIASIPVDIGDSVLKGQVLAMLDPAEMKANLNQANARFALADQGLIRFKDLKAKGFISNQELDKAQSEFLIAQSQVELYEVKLQQTKIIAPFNGIIQNRFMDEGVVLSPGLAVLEIIDSSGVEAHVSIPSRVIDSLQVDQTYSFAIGDQQHQATLKRFAPMTTQGSDNRLCIFEFKAFISPGSVSYLEFKQVSEKVGAWVPTTALAQSNQGLWNIFTLLPAEVSGYKVSTEIVELIYTDGINAYVAGTINSGDRVVIGGAATVIEGQLLRTN